MGLFIAKESQIAAQLKVIRAVCFSFSSPHHVTILASLNQRKGFVGTEKKHHHRHHHHHFSKKMMNHHFSKHHHHFSKNKRENSTKD